jgi:hypothetical protein
MPKRPYVDVPEGDNEENVHRPMNDEEYAQWQQDVKDFEERQAEEAAAPHPIVAQVRQMSQKDRAALREALGE